MREMRVPRNVAGWLAVDLAAIAILVMSGPFGTYRDLPFFGRLGYWAAAILVCGAMVRFSVAQFLATPALSGWPTFPRMVAGSRLPRSPARCGSSFWNWSFAQGRITARTWLGTG